MLSGTQTYWEVRDQEPFGVYDDLRSNDPIHWDDRMQGWLVTSFHEAAHVLRHEELFAFRYGDVQGAGEVKGHRSILVSEGQQHETLHRWLAGLVSGRIARSQEALIAEEASRVIDGFVARGRAELATEFAEVLPLRIIARMLGIPTDPELLARIRALQEIVSRWNETLGEDAEEGRHSLQASKEMRDLMRPLVQQRHRDPRDDLLSEVWRTGPSIIEGWSIEDALTHSLALLLGGAKTTMHMFCNLLYVTATRPEFHARLSDESARARYVEEVLRTVGVVHWRMRVATRDARVGTVDVNAGDRVYVLNVAADRDPERFPHPAELDLGRHAPKDHLAFGSGSRLCVGAPLARTEALVVLGTVLERLPGLRLDPEAEPPRLRGFFMRSYRPLHALFR